MASDDSRRDAVAATGQLHGELRRSADARLVADSLGLRWSTTAAETVTQRANLRIGSARWVCAPQRSCGHRVSALAHGTYDCAALLVAARDMVRQIIWLGIAPTNCVGEVRPALAVPVASSPELRPRRLVNCSPRWVPFLHASQLRDGCRETQKPEAIRSHYALQSLSSTSLAPSPGT